VDGFLSSATSEVLNTQQFSGSEDVFDTAESGERSRDGIVDALLLQREILSIECNDTDKIKTCLSTPVFAGHGEADENVKASLGEAIVNTFQSIGVDVSWTLLRSRLLV
jgi:hypothetical protein